MCGRFVASRPVDEIADLLNADDIEVPAELTEPRWNVAPQAAVLAVTSRNTAEGVRRRLTDFRWGLVPSWAKDLSVGARAFNARAETVAAKPAFRTALAKRRCLVPADAFYEWKKSGAGTEPAVLLAGAGGAGAGLVRTRPGRHEPWCITSADGQPLVFAGLYEVWRSPVPDHASGPGWHDDWLLTCTIITTDANDVVAPIHDRMPVMLSPEDWDVWLEPGELDEDERASLLRPAPNSAVIAYRVSTAVNYARTDGPDLLDPIDTAEQARLF